MFRKILTAATFALTICITGLSTNAVAVETGEKAPAFTLKRIDGKEVSLADFADKTLVLEWFNPGCPYVQKHYKNGDMQALQAELAAKGVVWLNINSTNASHKDVLTAEKTSDLVKEYKITSAQMLLDPEGVAGKAYGAKTTPHMFVIHKGTLLYAGAIDDNSDVSSDPKNATNFVRQAVGEVLANTSVSRAETAPYGCSVKYSK